MMRPLHRLRRRPRPEDCTDARSRGRALPRTAARAAAGLVLLVCAGSIVAPVAPLAAQTPDTVRLADLQRDAVGRDPRSAQSAMVREQAALRLANLRAERYPTFGVNAQAQYQSDVTHVNFPGAVLPYKDTYDANAGLRLRLLDPSRSARVALERSQLADAEARIAAATFAQRQAVNDAFFAALLLEAQAAVLASAIADLEVQLRLARERVAGGVSLPGDAALLEAELLRRRQSLDEASSGRAVALELLQDLTGRAIEARAVLALPDLDAPVRAARAALDAVRQRPEYAQFDAGGTLVAARTQAVDALLRPRLSAFARTGYGRPGLNMLAREFDTYWVAGVQLEWTPFDWGAADREREAIAIQRQVLAADERAFSDRLRRATATDRAALDRLDRALDADEAIVALRERVLAEARLRHAEGVITVGELVDRETELEAARLARVSRRVERAQVRARFLTTIGLEVR